MAPALRYGLAAAGATCLWFFLEYVLGLHTRFIAVGHYVNYGAEVILIVTLWRSLHQQLYGEMRDFTGRKLVEQKWGFSRNWRETGWMGNTTWLRAVCDVVMLYDDDSLEVVDHKTGKVYGDNAEQVELFALTAFERFGVAAKNGVKTRLIYVDSDQEQEAFYPGDDMDRIRAKWTLRAEKMLNDRKWLPRAGCRCKFCNMRVAGELRAY